MEINQKKEEKTKHYEKYIKQFSPKPSYFSNIIKAFIFGGLICDVAFYVQGMIEGMGVSKEDAGSFVTVILVCSAQLLTGIGVFDSIAKYAGAGVIVPITGFANSMVAPAIEYKKEGLILGVGAKLFSLAGPVLVAGICTSTVIGMIYYVIGKI